MLCVLAFAGSTTFGAINTQKLQNHLPDGKTKLVESLLPGEIAEIDVQHIALRGPQSYAENLSGDYDHFFLFIKGEGNLQAGGKTYAIIPEAIALPVGVAGISLQVPRGQTLHYIHIQKILTPGDREDIKKFPPANRSAIYFTRFDDCEAYTEKIKSPNTVSRTVLPKDHAPRVAMGTVQAPGPDKVGAHAHPMLDQLFLGLAGNDVTVHADEEQTVFGEFELLHIPLGSSHWVEVADGKQMYYLWMDFFMTKAGQEWLKTHKPVKK